MSSTASIPVLDEAALRDLLREALPRAGAQPDALLEVEAYRAVVAEQ